MEPEKQKSLFWRYWYMILPALSVLRWMNQPGRLDYLFALGACVCSAIWLFFYRERRQRSRSTGAEEKPTVNEPIAAVACWVFSALEYQVSSHWVNAITTLLFFLITAVSVWDYVTRNDPSTPPEA